MNHCPQNRNGAADRAVCLATTLRQALQRHGEITIRERDLRGLMGLTAFESKTVTLDPDLDPGEWRATLVHELLHLLRGPVPHRLADTEEAVIRRETGQTLVPGAAELAESRPTWTADEMQSLAARYQVDRGVIEDAISPPTLPFPIPAPRPAPRLN